MSSQNLELVRSIFADWERGEFFARAGWAHPGIECVMVDGPMPTSGSGLASMADIWREVIGPYEDFRATGQQYIEIDDKRILVLAQFSGRGKTSRLDIAQVQAKNASLFDIEGTSVRRLLLYWDRERAFADLGLAGTDAASERRSRRWRPRTATDGSS